MYSADRFPILFARARGQILCQAAAASEPAAEDGGEGRYGGDGSGPDPTAERRVPRNNPGRAETQSEWESSDEDDGLSSDGERGGDEYANEFCEMPADFDEWGGQGYDLDASGGGGYD